MAETKTKTKRTRKPKAEKVAKPTRVGPPAGETIPRAMLRTIVGVVSSDKGNKSITVVVDFQTKHHRLIRIIEKAPEQAVQVSAEEIMTGKAPEAR